MIGDLKVAKLLAGFRGKPAADVDALVARICGLSDFYLEHRHLLSDLEINPLIVLPGATVCALSMCGSCLQWPHERARYVRHADCLLELAAC